MLPAGDGVTAGVGAREAMKDALGDAVADIGVAVRDSKDVDTPESTSGGRAELDGTEKVPPAPGCDGTSVGKWNNIGVGTVSSGCTIDRSFCNYKGKPKNSKILTDKVGDNKVESRWVRQ